MPRGFSLSHGGPLYRLMRRARLVRGDRHDVRRAALAFVAITWLPLLVFGMVAWRVQGGRAVEFLSDLSVHARLLIAGPLFLVAEALLDWSCDFTVKRFAAESLSPAVSRHSFSLVLHRAEVSRDSTRIELLLLLGAVATPLLTWGVTGSLGLLHGPSHDSGLSFGRVWYQLVSAPLTNFLMFRVLWRWLIWAWLLHDFSRLDLRLLASHPDRAAGISYLARPINAFAVALMAVSAVFAAAWGTRIFEGQARADTFVPMFIVLLCAAELVAVAPLCVFFPALLRARHDGLHKYGVLALSYAQLFDERWVERSGVGHELLGSPDIQSMADMGNTFQIVERTRLVPFGKRTLVGVAVAMALPMVPLAATMVPLDELLKRAAQIMVG